MRHHPELTVNAPAPFHAPTAARSLRDLMRSQAAACEQARTLTPELVEALWSTGLMTWMNPRAAGGTEPSFRELIDTWQELAWQDGSLGWIGIANFPSAAFGAAYLPDAGFKEVFGSDGGAKVTMGGQFAPNGLGTRVDGGYRVSGAWNFGSGTGHSACVAAGFIPMVDGQMQMAASGLPVMLVAIVPRAQVNFTDGWFVQGLKGTGSYDYNLQDVFVPDARVYDLFTRAPKRGGTLYKFGVMPITAAGHASWALGVARSALDDVRALAQSKIRMGDMTTLAHKPTFQRGLSHHEGMWRAARLLVVETFTRLESEVAAGTALTPAMRAELRVAATYATESCREVVQWAHLAAGTSAIREGSRLERAFRDMYTGTQHAFIGEKTYLDAAQVMLGIVEDSPGL
jgi:alkylation response protein AidB-like acyl-CoA dehydrogenase